MGVEDDDLFFLRETLGRGNIHERQKFRLAYSLTEVLRSMEGRTRKDHLAADSRTVYRGSTTPREQSHASFPTKYFSAESLLLLLCLAASMLILPIILPPLPPPPLAVLLLPIGILVLLVILAFMPSDVSKIACPCEWVVDCHLVFMSEMSLFPVHSCCKCINGYVIYF